jgi:hypothetical protein
LTTMVGEIYFCTVGPGIEIVLGLLVCNWNSSDDTSMMGGDESCRGVFSLGIYGMVIGGTLVRGTFCSTSIKLSCTHTV